MCYHQDDPFKYLGPIIVISIILIIPLSVPWALMLIDTVGGWYGAYFDWVLRLAK